MTDLDSLAVLALILIWFTAFHYEDTKPRRR